MIALLKPLFPGPLAPHGEGLALSAAPPDNAFALTDLLREPDVLSRLLRRYAAGLGVDKPDLRAAASAWSMDYLQLLLPPVVVAATVLRHCFPVDAGHVAVRFNAGAAPQQFYIDTMGRACPDADATARYADLLWQHLQPLFTAIHQTSHLPVIGSNQIQGCKTSRLSCGSFLMSASLKGKRNQSLRA